MVILDLQKAFDTVNHKILISKLRAMGVGQAALKWFDLNLGGREQTVEISGVFSEFRTVTCGVPQGSILGPFLFLIYVNDMKAAVKCKLLLYADDSAFLALLALLASAELIIVGDINIHLDDATHHHTTDMMQTLHSYGLKQHIHEATHYCGHTLDVLINRDYSTLLSAIDVKDIGLCDDKGNLVNGHYAITCTLHHHAAEIKSKSVSYR